MTPRTLSLLLLVSPALAQHDPLAPLLPATPAGTATVGQLGVVSGFIDRAAWLAALGGSTTLIDFEAIANGTVITNQLAAQGVTLVEGTSDFEQPAGPTAVLVTSSAFLPFPMFTSGTLPSESNFISTRLTPGVYGTGTLTYTFDEPRTAVGAYIADQSVLGNDEIELFDAGGASIGVFSTPGVVLPSSFVGVTSTTPFARAEFRAANNADSWGMDNLEFGDGMQLGTRYCSPAVVNSTGFPGVLTASGSDVALDNDLNLSATDLPSGQFAYFIASRAQGFVPLAGGSQGNLCVVGNVVRFNAQVGAVIGGSFGISVDLTSLPEPPGFATVVVAGDSFSFQCWYRDVNPGATSNFTDAVEVQFL
jgi:hypothetical protein